MALLTTLILAALTVGLALLIKALVRPGQTALSLPPGPPAEPILGHLRVVPIYNPERAYMRWSDMYGSDILSFRILGRPVIVLNSVQAAVDLLNRRGANYSERPRFHLFQVGGWVKTLSFMPLGPDFRKHRTMLQTSFQKSSVVRYQPLQEREAARMLKGILERPADWEGAMRQFATAIVLRVGFGADINGDKDPLIQVAIDASQAFTYGGAPGGTPVDFFPLLRWLPRFLQDRSLKLASDWKWAVRRLHDKPYEAYLGSKKGQGSLVQDMLEQRKQQLGRGSKPEMTIDDIKSAAATVFIAGLDTTWSSMLVMVLNLTLHPEVQAKAQRAIDDVVGRDRLPSFEDRPRLPCIDRFVQETLRWCPVSPLGVPHSSIRDDEYKGYRIPAGSLVYANAWAMTHDESMYKNPDSFNPGRYLPVDEGGFGEPYPEGIFGFGRRICVGKSLAEASLWIAAATLLSTMTVHKPLDDRGNEVEPTMKLTSGLTCRPESFGCRILPRDDQAVALLRR
ncbi:hypothetical protein L249_4699 [Ophiocordyceps polyrhachis-furcata BCC 54312]|uniref:Cytochrome P450 n=1 Tax=Ophiocordyceps polyrhachis-furcata BCC 54312 TaxID=1330021 RepID=A0A367L2C4_9HYPO|nr:hypothetical protein L249_4699 [Ophiocordyceps polyrhachis-furcata BCC 54312]